LMGLWCRTIFFGVGKGDFPFLLPIISASLFYFLFLSRSDERLTYIYRIGWTLVGTHLFTFASCLWLFFVFIRFGLKKIDCESIKERYDRTCFAPLSRLLGTALQCFTGSTWLTRWRGSNSFFCRCVSFFTSFGRCVAWGGTERNRFWFTVGIVWAVLCVCVSNNHLFCLVSFRLIRCQPSPSTQ
jgi:hypothetical protein